MIPSLAKQFKARENSFLDAFREQRRVKQAQATLPALGKRLALDQSAELGKMPNVRHALPLFVPLFVPPPPPGMLEVAAAASFIPDLDRKLDPFPSGRSWYGNYTGPGNNRSDWEEDNLEPQTPLDRGPMQHDQEYSNLEEKYGYGHYETDSDGKSRFKGKQGSFLMMRFDTEHEGIHIGLIEADTRLMWRSAWYPAVGLTEGKYDLTFMKGPDGARNLVTDLLVAGVILTVFPALIQIDVAFLGITAGKHLLEHTAKAAADLGQRIVPLLGDPGDWGKPIDFMPVILPVITYKPFPHATMGSMWTQVGGYRIGGSGYLFGNKKLPYEIGMRNTTVADIAYFIAAPGIYGLLTGSATLLEFAVAKAFGWLVHETSAGFVNVNGASLWAASTEGVEYYGGQASGAAQYYGRQVSSGAKYYGGRISSSAKSAGRKASNWFKRSGNAVAGGVKSAGGKLSDAWKDLGGGISDGWKRATGGGNGGCFLTTACTKSIGDTEAQFVLNSLRAFRDLILLDSTSGEKLVREYYHIAPQIVQSIDASPAPDLEYRRIYRAMVLPTFRFVVHGRFTEAVEIYRQGVWKLLSKWCPELIPSIDVTIDSHITPNFSTNDVSSDHPK